MRAYEIKRVPANLYGSPCTPLIPLQTRISIFRNPKTKILCEREILATLSVPRNTNSKYLFSFLYISLFWDAQILWRTKKLLASCYILRRRYFFVNVCKRYPRGNMKLFWLVSLKNHVISWTKTHNSLTCVEYE